MPCYVLSPYPGRRFDLWNRLWLEHPLISYCLPSIHLFAKKTMFLEQSYCCSWEIYDDRKKQLTISVRGNDVRFSFWWFSRPTKAPFINSEQNTGIRSQKCLNLCNFSRWKKLLAVNKPTVIWTRASVRLESFNLKF